MNRSRYPIAAVVALFLMLFASTPALAQDATIGGVTLTLGASRADTMAAAETRLTVLPSRTSGYYNLYRKRAGSVDDGVQSVAIGALWFRNDRLIGVTRNLGAFQSFDGRAAIDNFIASFALALQENDEPEYPRHKGDPPLPLPRLTAKTEDMETDEFSISRIYFSFSDRTIQIAVFQPADSRKQASIAISEEYMLRDKTH